MRDKDLYARILGVVEPWKVTEIDLDQEKEEVRVHLRYAPDVAPPCPECGEQCPRYDRRERTWRHLDTCQFRTFLVADVPRVTCEKHGVVQVRVPWAEPGSGFTALFEAIVIDWMQESSLSAVARRMKLSWDEADGIQDRAVERGLARRKADPIPGVGVDETSFKKRHKYATIVSDIDETKVLEVIKGRESEPLREFFDSSITVLQLMSIEVVAMDMCPAFISAVRDCVPDADKVIAFDRFHVAKILNEGVNEVRREEHRALMEAGDDRLKGSRFLWLKNPENLDEKRLEQLEKLRKGELQVGRAWALKEMARHLWNYQTRAGAKRAWKQWMSWAQRSRIKPMIEAGKTIRRHLWGIVNAIVLQTTSGAVEGINAQIQKLKKMACGFRNFERFRRAILFHLGKLDLYPATLSTHTTS